MHRFIAKLSARTLVMFIILFKLECTKLKSNINSMALNGYLHEYFYAVNIMIKFDLETVLQYNLLYFTNYV